MVTKPSPRATVKPAPLRLYRVWRNTEGDESAHEIVVMATSVADAGIKAKAHVKSTNPGSGTRPRAVSQSLTTILSVKPVGDKHCLEISTVPLAALQAIPKKAVNAALASVAEKKAAKAKISKSSKNPT